MSTPYSPHSSPVSSAVLSTVSKPNVYCSFDIEADGNNPLQHSMRSFGAAMYANVNTVNVNTTQDSSSISLTPAIPIDTFYITIKQQRNARPDEKTMIDFWSKHPKQWLEINRRPVEPAVAMDLLAQWLDKYSQSHHIKWIARPANFDWMWLKCYYETYGPKVKPDIGFYCQDLTSLIQAYVLCNKISDKLAFITSLTANSTCTHNALDDALCQGTMYMNLRKLLSVKDDSISGLNGLTSDYLTQ